MMPECGTKQAANGFTSDCNTDGILAGVGTATVLLPASFTSIWVRHAACVTTTLGVQWISNTLTVCGSERAY